MGFNASMAREATFIGNCATTEIEKYILQSALRGGNSVFITEISPLYKAAINSYKKLLDLGYEVDIYHEYAGINSIVIYWGSN